jgi:hypothetical protein
VNIVTNSLININGHHCEKPYLVNIETAVYSYVLGGDEIVF